MCVCGGACLDMCIRNFKDTTSATQPENLAFHQPASLSLTRTRITTSGVAASLTLPARHLVPLRSYKVKVLATNTYMRNALRVTREAIAFITFHVQEGEPPVISFT